MGGPHPLDGAELSLEPIGVALLVPHHLLEDRGSTVVPQTVALLRSGVERRDGRLFTPQRERQHLLGGLSDSDAAQALHIRVPIKEQDATDECVCVAQILDGQVVENLAARLPNPQLSSIRAWRK